MLLRRFALGCLWLISVTAVAHDARPLSVTIVEQSPGLYRTVVRVPPTIETANLPEVAWPEVCESSEDAAVRADFVRTSLLRCANGIATQTLAIEYPFYNPSITTLISLSPLGRTAVTAVLPPDTLQWTAPAGITAASVAANYLALGFEHIWAGIDHLLFVAGLLLLARGARRLVLAITGFTLAHSLTLSLAALGLVRPAVEAERTPAVEP